jgi:hypothetical protein
MNQTINLNLLHHHWTAIVKQRNGKEVKIWLTAWPSSKHIVFDIISVSSDLPKRLIKQA